MNGVEKTLRLLPDFMQLGFVCFWLGHFLLLSFPFSIPPLSPPPLPPHTHTHELKSGHHVSRLRSFSERQCSSSIRMHVGEEIFFMNIAGNNNNLPFILSLPTSTLPLNHHVINLKQQHATALKLGMFEEGISLLTHYS